MRKLIHEITLFLKRVINSPVGELTRAQRALRFWIDLAWHCARALRHDRAGDGRSRARAGPRRRGERLGLGVRPVAHDAARRW